ncbi:hypothetical protein D3C76_1397910 [compost metagenome]
MGHNFVRFSGNQLDLNVGIFIHQRRNERRQCCLNGCEAGAESNYASFGCFEAGDGLEKALMPLTLLERIHICLLTDPGQFQTFSFPVEEGNPPFLFKLDYFSGQSWLGQIEQFGRFIQTGLLNYGRKYQ